VTNAGHAVERVGHSVAAEGHCVLTFGHWVGIATAALHSVGVTLPEQTVAGIGQRVLTVGNWVTPTMHWVNCRGQVVGTTKGGHTVVVRNKVGLTGQVVEAIGQVVEDAGKIVGRTIWSTATIRRIAVAGGGSPGTWTKTTCLP